MTLSPMATPPAWSVSSSSHSPTHPSIRYGRGSAGLRIARYPVRCGVMRTRPLPPHRSASICLVRLGAISKALATNGCCGSPPFASPTVALPTPSFTATVRTPSLRRAVASSQAARSPATKSTGTSWSCQCVLAQLAERHAIDGMLSRHGGDCHTR
jgi:hypothetical protein